MLLFKFQEFSLSKKKNDFDIIIKKPKERYNKNIA